MFRKERVSIEQKISDLVEFKAKKLSEEKEERSRKRKEIKKAKQKIKSDISQPYKNEENFSEPKDQFDEPTKPVIGVRLESEVGSWKDFFARCQL